MSSSSSHYSAIYFTLNPGPWSLVWVTPCPRVPPPSQDVGLVIHAIRTTKGTLRRDPGRAVRTDSGTEGHREVGGGFEVTKLEHLELWQASSYSFQCARPICRPWCSCALPGSDGRILAGKTISIRMCSAGICWVSDPATTNKDPRVVALHRHHFGIFWTMDLPWESSSTPVGVVFSKSATGLGHVWTSVRTFASSPRWVHAAVIVIAFRRLAEDGAGFDGTQRLFTWGALGTTCWMATAT